MSENPCPDPDTLSRWEDQELSPRETTALETHLDRCPSCVERASRVLSARRLVKRDPPDGKETEETVWERAKAVPVSPVPPAISRAWERHVAEYCGTLPLRRPSLRGVLRYWSAAAAILLACGLTVYGIVNGSVDDTEPHPRSWGGAVSRTQAEVWEPWDGIRIQTGANSRGRLQENRSTPAVRLEEGEITVDVDPGRRGFQVETDLGTVEVIGTRFSVRAVSLPDPAVSPPSSSDDFSPLPLGEGAGVKASKKGDVPLFRAILVRVDEGQVRLANAKGSVSLLAGYSGVLIEGERPFVQEPTALGKSELRDRLNTIRTAWKQGDAVRARTLWALLCAVASSDPEIEELLNETR